MAKFSTTSTTGATSVITTVTATPDTHTYEGAPAYTRDAKSDLFLLALSNLVGQDTFYEKAGDRDARFRTLIKQVTDEDPEWMQKFIPWLRAEGFMRSAPVVAVAEYVKAGGPNGRQLIANTLRRADEPAELLGYWLQTYGRKIPAAVKRGIADSATKLYNQRSAMRWDSSRHGVQMADVIELTHPTPRDDRQSDLFRYLLDQRHHGDVREWGQLDWLQERHALNRMDNRGRRNRMRAGLPKWASWEWLGGWLPGGMDAEAWEAVIPNMGYMATIRNLRNFDQAGISDEAYKYVHTKLTNPEEVARAMQFPFRFYSAWKAVSGLRWANALEHALGLATQNIPDLPGRSLVVIDTSMSMRNTWGQRSTVTPSETAAVFGGSIAKRCDGRVDLIWADTRHGVIPWDRAGSVLRMVDEVKRLTNGGGTYLGTAVQSHYNRHDRIFLISDMQFHDRMPAGIKVPIYYFNIGGYNRTVDRMGTGNRHEFGGLSDATFKMVPLLENLGHGKWPWE